MSNEEKAPQSQSKSKVGIIIAVVAVVLIVAIVAGLFLANRSPAEEESVAEEAPAGQDAPAEGADTAPMEEEVKPVEAELLANINLRDGPGTNYAKQQTLPEGTKVMVVGRNEDSSWMLVKTDDGTSWMTASAEFVKVDPAMLADLPVEKADAAPLAYNPSDPKVNQVLNEIPLVIYHESTFTCASHGGLNHIEGVADGNVVGPHSGDFVHTELGNVLFVMVDGELMLIRDNDIARFPGDQKYLSMDEALVMFQTGDVVWKGTIGEWPARGVDGCDPESKPN